MILSIVLWAAFHVSQEVQIRKVAVTGNNEAASAVRRKIIEGDCFNLVSKDADGTLAVEQHESSGGINGLASMLGAGSTTVVSAELTSKDGTVIWQDSKQGLAGISSTGAKNGAIRVLESLYKMSGCSKKGIRQ
jgi:hypothetical protein